MQPYSLTIAVCTFNGITRLGKVLQYLACQSLFISHKCLLLVVDNNSSDGTSDFVRQAWKSHGDPCDIKIISETKQGLGYARKAAVLNSTSEFLVFCDDDNWLQSNYLELALQIISANTSIGALGGSSYATSNGEIPSWFYDVSMFQF